MNYSEIVSRLQPDIRLACDQWRKQGIKSPNQALVAQTSNRIYTNACKRFPDLAEYARQYEKSHPTAMQNNLSINGVEIQQGGWFAGLIAFLLLADFFGGRGFRRRIRRRF